MGDGFVQKMKPFLPRQHIIQPKGKGSNNHAAEHDFEKIEPFLLWVSVSNNHAAEHGGLRRLSRFFYG